MSLIRQELELTSPREIPLWDTLAVVAIFHPFAENQPRLLSFPAYFSRPANGGAVEYKLVMDACGIITNAVGSNPHLTRKQDHERVPNDTIMLTPGDYFYCPDDTNMNYEIVTEFAAWRFPHNSLPPNWNRPKPKEVRTDLNREFRGVSASIMSLTVKLSDKHCLITKYRSKTQNAHLVPKEQIDWFTANAMANYCVGDFDTGINNVANGITLRSDVHLSLNLAEFVIYPEGDRFKIHMIRPDDDYSELLHWRLVEIPNRVSTEFLYTRFAYNVIKCLNKNSFGLVKHVKIAHGVKLVKEARLKRKQSKTSKLTTSTESESGDEDKETSATSDSSNLDDQLDMDIYESSPRTCDPAELTLSTEDFCNNDLDSRWSDHFTKLHPDLVEEVDDPPETRNGRHLETPRMLRLMSEYFRKNPQVWQSSATPSKSLRRDKEGSQLELIDLQTKFNDLA